MESSELLKSFNRLPPLVHRTVKTMSAQEIDAAAAKTHPDPSEAQKKAGNYRMGHIRWHGLDISIETARGGVRRGRDSSGTPWEVVMPAHYGFIRGAVGKDHDPLDVFVGEHPESEIVFVIDQKSPRDGRFDEHKVVICARNVGEARAIYDGAYSAGWMGFMAITPMTIGQFKDWMKHASLKRPASSYVSFLPGARLVKKATGIEDSTLVAGLPPVTALRCAVDKVGGKHNEALELGGEAGSGDFLYRHDQHFQPSARMSDDYGFRPAHWMSVDTHPEFHTEAKGLLHELESRLREKGCTNVRLGGQMLPVVEKATDHGYVLNMRHPSGKIVALNVGPQKFTQETHPQRLGFRAWAGDSRKWYEHGIEKGEAPKLRQQGRSFERMYERGNMENRVGDDSLRLLTHNHSARELASILDDHANGIERPELMHGIDHGSAERVIRSMYRQKTNSPPGEFIKALGEASELRQGEASDDWPFLGVTKLRKGLWPFSGAGKPAVPAEPKMVSSRDMLEHVADKREFAAWVHPDGQIEQVRHHQHDAATKGFDNVDDYQRHSGKLRIHYAPYSFGGVVSHVHPMTSKQARVAESMLDMARAQSKPTALEFRHGGAGRPVVIHNDASIPSSWIKHE